jgi:hypothetical protein
MENLSVLDWREFARVPADLVYLGDTMGQTGLENALPGRKLDQVNRVKLWAPTTSCECSCASVRLCERLIGYFESGYIQKCRFQWD